MLGTSPCPARACCVSCDNLKGSWRGPGVEGSWGRVLTCNLRGASPLGRRGCKSFARRRSQAGSSARRFSPRATVLEMAAVLTLPKYSAIAPTASSVSRRVKRRKGRALIRRPYPPVSYKSRPDPLLLLVANAGRWRGGRLVTPGYSNLPSRILTVVVLALLRISDRTDALPNGSILQKTWTDNPCLRRILPH